MGTLELLVLVGIVLAGVLANIVLDISTSPQGGHPWWFYLLRVLGLVIVGIPSLYSFYFADKRHRQSEQDRLRREGLDYLGRVLAAIVRNLLPGEDLNRVRANIMLVDGEELTVLSSWNMEAFPDNRMSLKRGQGVAGVVWKRVEDEPMSEYWKPVYAPNVQLSRAKLKSEWKLDEEMIRRTAKILWILSTPLFDRSGGERKFIGVVNLDGVTRRLDDMERLSDPLFHLQCVAAAETISEEIALRGLMPGTTR